MQPYSARFEMDFDRFQPLPGSHDVRGTVWEAQDQHQASEEQELHPACLRLDRL